MKRTMLIALMATTMSLSACGKKAEPVGDTASVNAANAIIANSAQAEIAPTLTPGQTFANTAASSDAFEIATSTLAEANAGSAAVKKFAKSMIAAHIDSTTKLKAAASEASPAITPDPALTVDQQQIVDGLKAKTGADFDTAYAQAQVNAHQATLDTLRAYAASGDVPALKSFAEKMVPVVTGHLNMAKSLK